MPKIVQFALPPGGTEVQISDNQVALEINSTDAEKYITLDTTDDASKVVLLGTHTAADNESSGLVGIREATPKAPLHIVGTGGSTGMSVDPTQNYSPTVFIENGSNNTKDRCLMILNGDGGSGASIDLHHTDSRRLGFSGYGSAAAIFSDNGVPLQISAVSGQYISFTTGGSESMRIDNDNKVGIGEDTPLGADGGSVHIKTADSGVGSVWANADEVVVEGSGESGITILSGNSSGTTSHGALIFGSQNSNEAGGIRYRHGATGVNNYLEFRAAGEQKAIVTRDGQIGIIGNGSTTASAMLMARSNMKEQLAGTFTATNGSANLTSGSSTAFFSEIKVGQSIKVGSDVHTVASIASNTQLTMDGTFTGTTGTFSATSDPSLIEALDGKGHILFRVSRDNTLLHTDGTLAATTSTGSILFCTEMSDSSPGDNCILIGARAGKSSTADGITVVGAQSCEAGTSTETTALGYYSGNAGPGNKNTLIGSRAGSGLNSNAQSNTLVGHKAGETIDGGGSAGQGDFNVCIGQEADGTQLAQNQIAIGYQTTCDANSQARIGDGSNYAELSFSSTPSSWSFGSDERIKENVTDTDLGLDFIKALRPIKHTAKNPADWPDEIKPRCFTTRTSRGPDGDEVVEPNPRPEDSDEVIDGLLAQEVKAVCDAQGVSFSGWTEGANGLQRLQYERFVLPLIESVKTLSSQIETLKERIEVLENGN